jgi:hypothetical protein
MKTDTCGKVKGMYGNHIHKYWKRVAAKAERRNARILIRKEQ